jgi:Tfp pilus assembly protein PilV
LPEQLPSDSDSDGPGVPARLHNAGDHLGFGDPGDITMSLLRQPPRGDETGMSMVEVIIYSALTALALSVLGGLFVVGLQTQAAASDRDAATGAAQVVSNSLQTSIRNASKVSVSDWVVKARVASGATGWQCVAWALTPDNKLVYKKDTAAITSTDYAAWTVLAIGVTGPEGGGAAFTGGPEKVSYSLRFRSGAVTVAGTVATHAFGTGSPDPCW